MNFSMAMDMLRNGRRIRRNVWTTGDYLETRAFSQYPWITKTSGYGASSQPWMPTWDDLNALDWGS